jgi:chromosome segregation ATPase
MPKNKRLITKKLEQLAKLLDEIEEAHCLNSDDAETWDSDLLYDLEENCQKIIKLLKDEVDRLKSERVTSEELENLEIERDQALRKQNELEQEVTTINNRLTNKVQELKNKENSLSASQKEVAELKAKYTKQSKLLDAEQLAAKKLEEEKEKLEAKIKELEGANLKLVKESSSAREEKLLKEIEDSAKQIKELEEQVKKGSSAREKELKEKLEKQAKEYQQVDNSLNN